MRTLKDRVAVITGAASGIGEALARQLHAEGTRLALVDVHAERLQAVAKELPGASVHVLSVADRDAMQGLVQDVVATHGGVNLVINNAGVTVNRPWDEHTLDDWDFVLGVNLWGVIHGCHFFLPELMKADEGHIVNVSSIFGIVGSPSQMAYCASKYGVRGLSEVLWEELDHTHVGVTVVHPGGVATRIVAEARQSPSFDVDRLKRRFARQGISPDDAARQILRAVRGGHRRCVITKEAVLMDWVKRIAPETANRFVAKALIKALGMQEAQRKRLQDYAESRR
jgi:NADP-dependent 3-hydroxy acid dehydrogenase YdfG